MHIGPAGRGSSTGRCAARSIRDGERIRGYAVSCSATDIATAIVASGVLWWAACASCKAEQRCKCCNMMSCDRMPAQALPVSLCVQQIGGALPEGGGGDATGMGAAAASGYTQRSEPVGLQPPSLWDTMPDPPPPPHTHTHTPALRIR